jgi:hypothetical protein
VLFIRNISVAIIISAVIILLPATGNFAETGQLIDFAQTERNDIPSPWKLVVKDGSPQTYITDEDGRKAICLKSTDSSFSIEREVDINIEKNQIISWRWKVILLPENGDFRQGNTNDQAAQLFLAFKGFFKKSISYIWDTNAPTGATGTEDWKIVIVKVLVVESGKDQLGQWVDVERNVYQDFKGLFGNNDPPRLVGVRFQINSQHTRSTAESCIESISFKNFTD